MDKKELWLALGALGIATPAVDIDAASERAGVAGNLNPQVEGQVSGDEARVLFVGSDIFRNEVISTGDKGVVHLMFLDQSSLTVGPNSELVIDRFVYDPDSGAGELTLSATKGVLRFVGGALSKSGKVKIKTPVGSLGIRGAITIIEIAQTDGTTTLYLLYGEEASATSLISNITQAVQEHEHAVRLTPDGGVEVFGPLDEADIEALLISLQGEESDNPPDPKRLTLPGNFRDWLELLAGEETQDDSNEDDASNADTINSDVDSMGS